MIFLMLLWFAIGWLACNWLTSAHDPASAVFSQALDNIENKAYKNPPSRQELTYTAINAMLASIQDSYATFRDPVLSSREMQVLAGSGEAAIGIQGEMKNGQFFITAVTPDMPAAKNGLQVGDVITKVDGWQVKPTATTTEVLSMVRSNQYPTAQIEIMRSDQPIKLNIPRQSVQAVIANTIDQIAYLRFDIVDAKAPQALKTGLEQLLKTNPKGLILDLRYNGGGLMDATQKILDLFEKDGMAFYAKTRDGKLVPFATQSGDIAEEIPLVVLIGHQTYSASETMAASLKERGRGVLIGETTHGKGSIVENVALKDGSSFQITVARWLSPVAQKDYEGLGVAPDDAPSIDPSTGEDALLDYAVSYLLANTKTR